MVIIVEVMVEVEHRARDEEQEGEEHYQHGARGDERRAHLADERAKGRDCGGELEDADHAECLEGLDDTAGLDANLRGEQWGRLGWV